MGELTLAQMEMGRLEFQYHVAVNALRSKKGRFISEDTAVGYFHGGQNDMPDLHMI